MEKKYIGYRRELILGSGEDSQVVAANELLKMLTDFHEDHLCRNMEELSRFEKFLDSEEKIRSKNLSHCEAMKKMAPTSVIDAKWGSGKTYFIENFKFLFDKDLLEKNEYYKGVIVIDAMDILLEDNKSSILQLYEIIWPMILKELDIKRRFLKYTKNYLKLGTKGTTKIMLNMLMPEKIKSSLNKADGDSSEKKEKHNFINKIDNELKKNRMILFIDNIERLGRKHSWNLIRELWRLSMFKGMHLVLILNITSITGKHDDYANNEYPLEKMFDSPIIEFKQNYINILKKYSFKDSYIEWMNGILSESINNEILSVRQVERLLMDFGKGISEQKTEIESLIKFDDEIWKGTNAAFEKCQEIVADGLDQMKKVEEIFIDKKENFATWLKPEFAVIPKNIWLRENNRFFSHRFNFSVELKNGGEDIKKQFEKLKEQWEKINPYYFQFNKQQYIDILTCKDELLESIKKLDKEISSEMKDIESNIDDISSKLTEMKNMLITNIAYSERIEINNQIAEKRRNFQDHRNIYSSLNEDRKQLSLLNDVLIKISNEKFDDELKIMSKNKKNLGSTFNKFKQIHNEGNNRIMNSEERSKEICKILQGTK